MMPVNLRPEDWFYGVGVVTSDGTARMVLRHLLSHLGRDAGEAFADLYVEKLGEVAEV
ncbi:MAG: hypothetical protein ACLFSW_03780 [Halobacteriales archaeon]